MPLGGSLVSSFWETIQDHLESFATMGRLLVLHANFFALEGILVEIVKGTAIVDVVVPVPHHAEVAGLSVDPVAFFEGIVAAAENGNEGFAVDGVIIRDWNVCQFEDSGEEIGGIDEVSAGARLGDDFRSFDDQGDVN